jgi:hypothetical protein
LESKYDDLNFKLNEMKLEIIELRKTFNAIYEILKRKKDNTKEWPTELVSNLICNLLL